MKNGQRQMKVANDKKVKQHVKAFYNILETMQSIAGQLDSNIEYNEDNINDYVRPMLGRDLDNMEKFLVLTKVMNRE